MDAGETNSNFHAQMDELYVMARRVLLEALDALGQHRDAAVLLGTQAV